MNKVQFWDTLDDRIPVATCESAILPGLNQYVTIAGKGYIVTAINWEFRSFPKNESELVARLTIKRVS